MSDFTLGTDILLWKHISNEDAEKYKVELRYLLITDNGDYKVQVIETKNEVRKYEMDNLPIELSLSRGWRDALVEILEMAQQTFDFDGREDRYPEEVIDYVLKKLK